MSLSKDSPTPYRQQKATKPLFYAQRFVQMSLAKGVLVAHSWAARRTLAGAGHLHTRGCGLTSL